MSIQDFEDMMVDTVSHEEVAGRDFYNQKTYGSLVNYTARVVYKQELIRVADGSEKLSKGVVWFLGSPTIDPEDRVTLPDSSTPPILATTTIPDESGSHHTKLWFG